MNPSWLISYNWNAPSCQSSFLFLDPSSSNDKLIDEVKGTYTLVSHPDVLERLPIEHK